MIRIRPSRPEDATRVVDIWRRSVDATHHFLSPDDRRDIEAEVASFLPGVPLWLAVDAADRPMGFMLLGGSHMEALFIDPDHRGTGIGRALVTYALALQPCLTTDVNEQNAQAVGFYARMGFHPVGRSALDGRGRAYPLIYLRYRGGL